TAVDLVGLTLISGLLMLTHYWSLYLLLAVGAGFVAMSALGRPERRTSYRLVLLGIAGGGILFAPWLPVFVYQLKHTGTPWAQPGHGRRGRDGLRPDRGVAERHRQPDAGRPGRPRHQGRGRAGRRRRLLPRPARAGDEPPAAGRHRPDHVPASDQPALRRLGRLRRAQPRGEPGRVRQS